MTQLMVRVRRVRIAFVQMIVQMFMLAHTVH
jgi:hypothetical protein